MRDLQSPRLMYAKAVGFVLIGGVAAAVLIIERPTIRTALLVAAAVWGFARAYYFAFYVIERYIDPTFRFAGLWSAVGYVMRNRSSRK